MIVQWDEIADAVGYTVAVIDTTNPDMYTVPFARMFSVSADRETTVTNLS